MLVKHMKVCISIASIISIAELICSIMTVDYLGNASCINSINIISVNAITNRSGIEH